MLRAVVTLLFILSAGIQDATASGAFEKSVKRAKDEASHVASSLRDKERMQAKLQAMRNDLADLYKLTLSEAQRVAGPYLQAGHKSWVQFRARMAPTASRAESWLKEQRARAVALHLRAVEAVQGHIARLELPQAQAVKRSHVEAGLFAAYSGIAALLIAPLLMRLF